MGSVVGKIKGSRATTERASSRNKREARTVAHSSSTGVTSTPSVGVVRNQAKVGMNFLCEEQNDRTNSFFVKFSNVRKKLRRVSSCVSSSSFWSIIYNHGGS